LDTVAVNEALPPVQAAEFEGWDVTAGAEFTVSVAPVEVAEGDAEPETTDLYMYAFIVAVTPVMASVAAVAPL
jgi:hypothetical protein